MSRESQKTSDANEISRNEMLRMLATAPPDINIDLSVRTDGGCSSTLKQ